MTESEYKATSVQMAWDNHFAAFGTQDMEKILLDYDETSVASIFDWTSGEVSTYKGLSGITELFTKLFKELTDMSEMAGSVVEVVEDPKSAWVCWKCPSSGITSATDTFIFGDDFKIKRQNVVMTKKA
eukprot:CAMPEP_0194782388 /NCGR_PEP_ID=MMETSP0323_2-20130528/78663_1 /TAXON_ID=2866 ORGANISM="Crypthecodinium cohnii, Strain Seligo" /NCGR_SAMPLE_ID=MMETSP0323_2 /ASSEMBLY_ACC=CAM_ASM_000346 /LENGTH=127 /DNA_ID=CAMNT_0039721197 /DNA_START=86 /DNA_END=469 /DNA_ORIENTATION=+